MEFPHWCGNFMILLSLRFYVKSIFVKLSLTKKYFVKSTHYAPETLKMWISSNQLFSIFFIKNVTFTKFVKTINLSFFHTAQCVKSWFHEIFFDEREFLVFLHSVPRFSVKSVWTQSHLFDNLGSLEFWFLKIQTLCIVLKWKDFTEKYAHVLHNFFFIAFQEYLNNFCLKKGLELDKRLFQLIPLLVRWIGQKWK